MKNKLLVMVLTLSLLVTGSVALANGSYVLTHSVLNSGTTQASYASISLQATMGQPIIGEISNGNFSLWQGFWELISEFKIYVPLILK